MVDITVMGAGIFGLSVAWSCARRGARVRVIDPHDPGAGASGGIVGAMAPHVPELWNSKKAFQLDSLLMAAGFWAEVAEVSNLSPGYASLGRLQPIADAAALALAQERSQNAATLWQGQAEWRIIPASGPWCPETDTGQIIHDTLTARLHPRQACAALVAALHARGAEVVTEGPMTGRILWATGIAGLEALSAAHTRSVGNGVKGQGALLAFDARNQPQIFANQVHIVPHEDGTTAVGSTSERNYDDPTSTDAQLDDVIARAVAAVPALAGAPVVARWAGVRPRSRSRAPMLGAHPFRPGEFVANGGFKIGFGMAPKVGAVMADLMLDGIDSIPDDFKPEASL
ncbi:Glycine oxidase [Roseovarius sp. EC-HK134]|uniref:NAD(P)/FAD-dependent oxidoreductase n=1 Tax=unclassified Roseovarius TaxID=2614913 RepID=UPI0012557F51|nr:MULTISPECIES: FAD-dependent oxidoreductase [unclassified Roseovarius]VVT02964.1 Glycine oxidase [Roseovarius sp. EC-HK134]VVT03386.1 Glycine oxidase [Roseovarius sp. EC-SD190]